MTSIKVFHVVALGMLLVFRFLLSESVWLYGPFYALYTALLVGLLLDNLWCARLLVVPPLLVVLATAPFVGLNVYLFVTRAPLYLDSPATIFVVAVVALFTTLPSTLVLGAYWTHRKRIFGVPLR